MRRFLSIVGLVVLASCTTAPLEAPVEPESIVLNKSTFLDSNRLNVSITVFDTGNSRGTHDPEDNRENRFYARVRDVESDYMAVILRDTLVATRHWGAVRVMPETDPAGEILVTAEILQSDAVTLSLWVRVNDSRGKIWIDQEYADRATSRDYEYEYDRDGRTSIVEPFQDMYNQIANDIYEVRKRLTAREVSQILDTSTLRYAIALSPEAFGQYLETDAQGLIEMTGLPARDNPMYRRARRIRESEYRFTDTVDKQFGEYFNKMQTVYPYWRRYSYELIVYNRQLEQPGRRTRTRNRNRWNTLEDVYNNYKDFKLNEDALRELALSFESEIKPTVAELEGKVVELNGSLKVQYKNWRSILREIYVLERGE